MKGTDTDRSIDLARTGDFSLGDAHIRPSLREVRIGETVVTLEPRVMQVLVALAASPGEVVSRDMLVEAAWGGRIVGEDAIQRCIARLRRLADEHGCFAIETVTRVGYRLLPGASGAVSAPAAAPAAQPRLAVLPFDMLSSDPDDRYFADGLSDELLQAIAQTQGITVVGRTASFAYRGDAKVLPRIAAELNVTHLLDGSVRRTGERIRVTAYLMEVAGQTMLWSDRFDAEQDAVYELEDMLAGAVMRVLDVQFAPRGDGRTALPAPVRDLFLRAIDRVQNQSAPRAAEGAALLEQVVARVPGFADGWGQLAFARTVERLVADSSRRTTLAETATAAAQRALALDPDCGPALKALYLLAPVAGAFAEQEAILTRALRRNPADADLHWAMQLLLSAVGRRREALTHAENAYRLDPLRPLSAITYAHLLYTSAERSEEALALFGHAVARWPDNALVLGAAAWSTANGGDWAAVDRFKAIARDMRLGETDRRFLDRALAATDLLRDPSAQAVEAYVEMLDQGVRDDGRLPLAQLAFAAQLGADLDRLYDMVDRADFSHLFGDQAAMAPADGLLHLFLRVTGRLRESPRFVALCARFGLTDYWIESGHWPDFIERRPVPYDFKAAVAALRTAQAAG